MILRKLTIQGFRSFRDPQVFVFPTTSAGFYQVTGENRVEPDLGANGSGKSTIWDALVWCLYGKTARGSRAKAVSNWDGDCLTKVELEFTVGKIDYKLRRTWNPNSLTLQTDANEEWVPAKDEEIVDLIGCHYEGFLNIVLMGQFNRFFFDLSPTEKLNVFSEALDLSIWAKAADSARAAASKDAKELSTLERNEAALEAALDMLERQVSEFTPKAKEFDKIHEKKMLALVDEADKLDPELARLEQAAGRALSDVSRLTDEKDIEEQKLVKLDTEERKAQTGITDLTSKIASCDRDITRLRNDIHKLNQLEGNCPTCKQTINDDNIDGSVNKLDNEISFIEKERADFESLLKKARKAHKETCTLAHHINEVLNKIEDQLRDSKDNLSELNRKKSQTFRRVAEIDKELEALENEENIYQTTIDASKLEIDEKTSELTRLRSKLMLRRDALTKNEFWAKQFKDVRLWIIDQALVEFEVHCNASLQQLGLHGWKIEFDAERENSSGGVTRGFTVNIYSPISGDPVPWESWSGGETQRLRIAGAIGLANLLGGRRGFDCNIEVWDEPTAHLSEEGVADLVTFFECRAREQDTQIYLVDHRSLSSGDFDDVYKIVKDKFGSKIAGADGRVPIDRTGVLNDAG